MSVSPSHRITAATTRVDDKLGREVMSAFRGPIAPVRSSVSYRLGLLLVALVMLLLPLIYLGLIVAVAWLVWLHLQYSVVRLERVNIGTLLLYVAPLVMGGLLIFFMVKPIFAPPGRTAGSRSLTRDGEPLLFAFVDKICETVGSPKPTRIDVNADANAGAAFRNGWLGMVTRDMTLVIGVPLVAGLTMQQFAGVLAHEFGHFSQGAGLRLSFLIRNINAWFERVVYQRDGWDQWLRETAEDSDMRIGIVLYVTMALIHVTRYILWFLMMTGHLVSALFLRQMEFDADRYEARVSGSQVFATTQNRVSQLSLAHHNALNDLQAFMREGRLGDNLPMLVAAKIDQLSAIDQQQLEKLFHARKTGWFDTHPADAERIASAAKEQAEGIFALTYPAKMLFSNFDQLAKNVTWDLYRSVFGQSFQREAMHSTDALLATVRQQQERNQAIKRFSQDGFTLLRKLQLPGSPPQPPSHPKQTLEGLKQAREAMLAESARHAKMLAEFDKADTRLLEVKQVVELLYAQQSVKASEYQVPTASTKAALRAREEAEVTQGRLDDKLKVFETALGSRIHLGLSLLFVAKVAERIEGSEQLRRDIVRHYETINRIAHHLPTLTRLRNEVAGLGALFGRVRPGRNSEALIDSIQRSCREVHRLTVEIRDDLLHVPYPFEHAQGEISIGKFCLRQMPMATDLGAIHNSATEIMDGFFTVYVRLVGHLVSAAEQVETVVGLPKLEEPLPASASP